MSASTPTAEARTTAETRTGHHPGTGTTGTGRSDPWADSTAETSTSASAASPRTFDPFCSRRLRNCIDAENAAFPDTE